MSSINTISIDKLARLIGTPRCPVLIDVQTDEDFAADPRLIPGAIRRPWSQASGWAKEFVGQSAIVICQKGLKLSQGVAAWLRHAGIPADSLEGGALAWAQAGLPMVPEAVLPPRDGEGTHRLGDARPSQGRPHRLPLAHPPLRRSAGRVPVRDRHPKSPPSRERFGAAPFDIEGEDVFWSHRGEICTFDIMVEEFGLATEPLLRLATIVRGADTARPDLAPEAPGLLAASLGLSRMYADDLEQLEAGMALYDAFYRWCRDATDETHNWPVRKQGA